jgi:hypothetical protein
MPRISLDDLIPITLKDAPIMEGKQLALTKKKEKVEKLDQYSIKTLMKKYDIDGSGEITENEMNTIERIIELESKKAKEKDRDKRENAQRAMAWFALFGMLLYPFSVVIAIWLGLDHAAEILGTMANIYFVSVAAIVAAFFGAQAYSSSHSDDQY